MRQIAIMTLAATLVLSPVQAEDKPEGPSLMEQGAKLLLEGLMQEMEPAIEDLRKFSEEVEPGLRRFVQEMGPALGELFAQIDDFTAYHPPEMLPNGDIILRRKTPMEQLEEKKEEGEEIDL